MQKGNYTDKDKDFMCLTDKSRNASRIRELINFIKLSGYQKIGIASCACVKDKAETLREMLQKEGILSVVVNCKESQLNAADLSPELSGLSCDPKGQAEYLNTEQTDFNINFGLCLGHGLLFQKYSAAPVTTLVVKDIRNKHNIMENFI